MKTEPILFAGDWHGNQTHARWAIDHAAKHGAARIVQCGDFGYWEHAADGVKFLDLLQKYAAKRGVVVYFIDGNHDKTSLLLGKYTERDGEGFILVRPDVRYAPRGYRWTWGAVRFIALGGAYSVDKQWRLQREAAKAAVIREQNSYRTTAQQRPVSQAGTLWFPEEEMTDGDLAGFLADVTPVDVIVSHDKPRGASPDWNRKDLPECYPNQDRIQRAAVALQAKLVVHGHLHYRYTAEVMVGDDLWCTVEGLDADPESAHGPRADSVMLFDVGAPIVRPDVAAVPVE